MKFSYRKDVLANGVRVVSEASKDSGSGIDRVLVGCRLLARAAGTGWRISLH